MQCIFYERKLLIAAHNNEGQIKMKYPGTETLLGLFVNAYIITALEEEVHVVRAY